MKLKYWRGSQTIFNLRGAPVLDFMHPYKGKSTRAPIQESQHVIKNFAHP